MKMSRVKKYHNSQEVPKESRQYHLFKNVGVGCVLIALLILALYFITQLTTPKAKATNHISSSVEEVISSKTNSKKENSSSYIDYLSEESQESEYSSSSEDNNGNVGNDTDSQITNNAPQGSNQTFNSLQDAINYGKQSVANGTCGNYRVINVNGKFRTELF